MKLAAAVVVLALAAIFVQVSADTPRERARKLLALMTTEEKFSMVRGYSGSGYVGYVKPIPRLRIPAIVLQDGPQVK